jgi:ubiquinone biosynthesis protein UbiJ
MFPIPSFLAPAVVAARALNQLLRREEWARDRLARHSGKTVRFSAGRYMVGLSIQADGYVTASDPAVVPDVTLTVPAGRLGQLAAALRGGQPDEIAALLHVQGDAGLAQVVSELARDLRWDVEAELAALVGDVAALRLMGGVRMFGQGVRRAGERLAGNVGEYLSEESRTLLGRPAYEQWGGDLAQMQARLDGLERRAARLESRAGPGRRGAPFNVNKP